MSCEPTLPCLRKPRPIVRHPHFQYSGGQSPEADLCSLRRRARCATALSLRDNRDKLSQQPLQHPYCDLGPPQLPTRAASLLRYADGGHDNPSRAPCQCRRPMFRWLHRRLGPEIRSEAQSSMRAVPPHPAYCRLGTQGSTLRGLVEFLQQIFEAEPPLYSKPPPRPPIPSGPFHVRPSPPPKPPLAPSSGAQAPASARAAERPLAARTQGLGAIRSSAQGAPVYEQARDPIGTPTQRDLSANHSHPASPIQGQRQADIPSRSNLLDDELGQIMVHPPGHSDASSRGPPPPRPVHPAILALRQAVLVQLASRIEQLSHALDADHGNLAALQSDLLQGAPALTDELARLSAVDSVCSGVAARYASQVSAAEAAIADVERRGETDPDEMVCSTTVLYNQ